MKTKTCKWTKKCRPFKIQVEKRFQRVRRKEFHTIARYVNFCNPYDRYGLEVTDKPTGAFLVCSCHDQVFVGPPVVYRAKPARGAGGGERK